MRSSVIACLLMLLTAAAVSAERPTDAEIRALVSRNLEATQANDMTSILETIHPDSLARANIAPMIESLKAYKLRYTATSVEFVCMQGEHALVRVLQQTTRISGPDFLDNEIDGIWALRLDDSGWKYWSQMVLTLRPLSAGSK